MRQFAPRHRKPQRLSAAAQSVRGFAPGQPAPALQLKAGGSLPPLTLDSGHDAACNCPGCQAGAMQMKRGPLSSPAAEQPLQRMTPLWLPGLSMQMLVFGQLAEAVRQLVLARKTLLQPAYVETLLSDHLNRPVMHAGIAAAMQQLMSLPGGAEGGEEARKAFAEQLPAAAGLVLKAAEREFILDPDTSSLDLLPEGTGAGYRKFKWDEADYPGGAQGKHEGKARAMHHALGAIHPERRPNSTETAVMTEKAFIRYQHAEAKIRKNLERVPPLPGTLPDGSEAPAQPAGPRMHRLALEAFLRMRDAALADGVPIIVLAGWRSAATAKENAEKADNPSAVAKYSSHTLGLAVDLKMGVLGKRFTEISTKKMKSNVIPMRESAAHKWMFLHGPEYGWHAWHNEPWHWEYNPDGFKEQYLASLEADAGAKVEADGEEHGE